MDELLTVFFWASAVRLAAPMFIASIGETVVQRAGMFNVGIEGMMLIGAFVGVAARSGDATYTGVVAAALVTGVVGLLYGVVVAVLRADQIVAGVGLNIIAIGTTSLLRRLWGLSTEGAVPAGILGEQAIPVLVDIPFLGGVLFRQSPLVYLAYVVLPMVAFFLMRTRSGLLLRSVGESAVAADSAGVSVLSKRVWAMTFGGVMAGLAGAYLSVVATSGVFIDNMTLGRGFLAIAITILAGWRPGWGSRCCPLLRGCRSLAVLEPGGLRGLGARSAAADAAVRGDDRRVVGGGPGRPDTGRPRPSLRQERVLTPPGERSGR